MISFVYFVFKLGGDKGAFVFFQAGCPKLRDLFLANLLLHSTPISCDKVNHSMVLVWLPFRVEKVLSINVGFLVCMANPPEFSWYNFSGNVVYGHKRC